MTHSQKLHLTAVLLFAGGLLVSVASWIAAIWNGLWILSIMAIIASLWLEAATELHDAGAAHRAAVRDVDRDS